MPSWPPAGAVSFRASKDAAVMDVVMFRAAIAARTDGEIVIACFDGGLDACVAILKGSPHAAEALLRALEAVLALAGSTPNGEAP